MKSSDERLLRLLKEARYALEAERKRRTEPIAIVGIGCRFPGGAAGPRAFWKLLEQGVDATCPVPLERWDARALYDPDPNAPGKCYTQRGGFLDQVSGFEPEFFGISPREAAGLDPQQRLLLEVTWEALEDAGIPADRLAGSATGVWVGLSLDDYARRCIPTGHLERIDAYTALGNARSVAAGRIAYVLGLHGPVLQLDTACSSSLVAVHLACQSLRSGECELAIVGGVNVMSSPEASVALCRLQALAPDGRCKTFDAAADGYGRGEGCGVVVLKRLAAARAAGDHIHAVIRGSAVNHDGRSNGLTAPNGAAQEAVLRSALTDAGVDPAHVGYVEAHGTGTLLGDPIEVLALSRVYGAARAPEQPLVLGSVKTNFGHLEAAAGVAALIKTALCLEHGQLAPHLHFHKPNPKIPWAQLPVRVATQNEAFPRGQGGAFAGVSSFGISGTNAHVVLEAVSSIASGPHAVARSAELVVLSARTEPALKALARELSSQLAARPELSLAELAFSSMTARAAMDRRWAFAVSSRAAFEAALEAALAAENAPVTTTDSISRPKVAFIFPGQGSQWPGMGRSLLLEEPVFREAMQACDAAISRETGWSVLTELESGAQFDRIEVVQPLLFAMQVSLAALWRSWGVEPDVVVGHSMGEAAAACVAGSLSLEDGARVICRRSKLLRRISGKGEMALVELSIDEAKAALRGFEDRLGVAVSNARHSTVLSGEPAALASVLATLEARGVFCRRVKVDVASHSPQVDPLLAELVSQLTDLAPVTETIPIYSTVTGRALSGSEQTARYWADNLRKPVRFADAVEGLIEQGFRLFVELSPHPLLLSAIEELRGQAGVAGTAVGSLRREQPERLALLDALGALYTHGMPLQPERLFPNGMIGGKNGLRRIELPTYPWQRENYWLEAPVHLAGSAPESGHPLLGVRVATAAAFAVYETLISEREPGWLVDHRVGGEAVLPAAAILELVRASAEDAHDGLSCEVSELVLASPLVLRAGQTTRLQLVLSRDSDSDALSATLCSQPADAVTGTAWTRHATARAIPVSADVSGAALPKVPVGTLRARCSTSVDVERLHAGFLTGGIQYGSAFRGLRYVSRGEREVIAELELHSSLSAQGYGVHPALLDAALQASAALLPLEATGQAFLPFGCERYRVQRAAADNALVHVELIDASPEHLVVDVTLCEPTGEVIAEIDALHARRADVPRLIERASSSKVTPNRHELYRLSWREAELRGIDTPEKSTAPLSQQRQASRWGIVALGPHSSGDLHESANLHERSNLQRLGEALSDLGAAVDHLDLAALEASAVEHVVCVWDVGEDATAATRAAIQALQIVQALTRRNRPTRLWWITRRVFSELTDGVSEPAVVSPAAATVWGVGRTLRQEHPELNCKLIDCDANEPEFAASVARILNAELAAQDEEDELRYCRGRRYVARLSTVPGHRPSTDSRASVLSASGTVLITGGLGALGLMLARGCAERGARRLLLVGRRGAETPGTTEALAELQRIGAEVEVAAIDIADAASLARLIAAIPAEFPLRGVIHAAGVLDDGLFAQQTPERFQAVMAPKVIGAWNLHLLTQSAGLDWFVLVSSIAGTLGSSGQSAYAAANCYLDALAAARRARGLVASSIAFGPLSERGLAANLDSRAQTRLSRQGFQFLTLQEASDQLLRSLQGGGENLAVAAIDLRKLSQSSRAQVPPLWRALLRSPARSALRGAEVGPPSTFVKRLEALPREEQLALTTEIVRAEVARVLSLASPVAVPLEKPLKELGLDSLMALELRNGLSRRTSITLPAAVLVQQPSVRSVSEYITASALGDAGSAPGSSVVVKSAASVPFEMDATLDEEIRPPTATQAGAAPASDARSVLLTGATGFLGAYLLAELLREPGTHIHCLVRARDAAAGRARVVENLRQYGLWNDAHGSRVHVLIGDLTQPRLGLDASTFAELAEGVDAIYNNGAVLGFVADYPDLKASHVDATREVLRLASIGVAKFVHHVSSAVVFDSSAYRGQELPESTLPVETRGLQLGYSQCKWVSENLIWKAAARGFPVTVYRPAFIAGASTTGAWNTADFLCRTLKTTIELGTIPGDLELDLELSPVDYVSRAIVHLSRQPDSRGRAFHLQHPSGLSFQRLAEILRSCGYGVREVPYWEWIAQIEARPTDPLAAVLPFLAQRLPPDRLTHIERWQRQYRPKLTCMETLRTLGRANIECPAIDARLIGRYLDYLGEIGFIPRKPAKAGAR